MEQVTILSTSESDIVGCYYACSATAKKGAVLVGCAMGITQKYYTGIAEFLTGHGYEVLTFDFRGTGLSSPRRLRGFEVDLFDWADDISAALRFLKLHNDHTPILFVGHSISSQLFGFSRDNHLADKAVFIASSTGYWRDGGSMRWKNLLLLGLVLPFSNLVWGYTNAKFFGQGENYPKNASFQWRRWCFHPDYLKVDLNPTNDFFSSYTKRIVSVYFADDSIATRVTAKKLLEFYPHARVEMLLKSPREVGVARIGHSGFLSRKFKDTLWLDLLTIMEQD